MAEFRVAQSELPELKNPFVLTPGAHTIIVDVAKDTIFDEQIQLLDEKTKEPVAGYPFYVEKNGTKVLFSYTDNNGMVPRIDTGNREGEYIIFWGDEALYKNGA